MHQGIEDEVAAARHLHRPGFLGLEIGRALGRIADGQIIDHRIDQRDHAGENDRRPPALGTSEHERDSWQRHGRGRRPEIAEPGIDALRKADLLGRKPLRDHADADDKSGTDQSQEKTGDGERHEVLRQAEQHAQHARDRQQCGVDQTRTEPVDQHPDDDAGGDGERHVEDQQGGDFRVGQSERGADRRQQWGMIEPDHKAHEKGEPGEMENSDPGLETK